MTVSSMSGKSQSTQTKYTVWLCCFGFAFYAFQKGSYSKTDYIVRAVNSERSACFYLLNGEIKAGPTIPGTILKM